jgi:hypothetical protein
MSARLSVRTVCYISGTAASLLLGVYLNISGTRVSCIMVPEFVRLGCFQGFPTTLSEVMFGVVLPLSLVIFGISLVLVIKNGQQE